MEPISAGASVLAFVLLGLQSAKVAYEVLSAVKDGKTHMVQARNSVLGLQSTLERLSRCRLVAEQQDEFLLKTVKECADNMKTFAEQLGGLDASRRGVERQWNKVKILLKEDDFKRMSAAVVGHTAALSFYLGILESETILAVRDDVRAMLPVQQSIRETQTAVLTQHTTLTTLVQDSITQTTNEAHAIRETIQTFTQGLPTQADVRHLNDLLERALPLLSRETAAPRVVEIADDGSTEPKFETGPEDEIEASIFFVVEALQDRSGIFANDEARKICDALIDFLDKAFSPGHLLFLKTGTNSWARNDDGDLRALRENLRDVKSAIMTSRRVVLNEGGQKRPLGNGKMLIASRETRFNQIKLRSGTISVRTTESRSQNTSKHQTPGLAMGYGETFEEMDSSVYNTDTRISFIPRLRGRTTKGQGFHAIFQHSHGYQGSYHRAIPRLFAHRIIPNDSPVFQAVRDGELAKFQEMLMRGEASLRDQDEHGTSLLFYAHRQPNMCRFLLQYGADADHFATYPNDRNCAGNAMWLFRNVDSIYTGSQEATCQRLLLDAGCDPSIPGITVEDGKTLNSLLELELLAGNENFIRMLGTCGFGQAYASSTTFLTGGETPFEFYLLSSNVTVTGLSLLLQQGADVHARSSVGRTCLHNFFSSAQWPFRRRFDGTHALQIRDACDLLVRHGADVDAVDRFGTSVSSMAYEKEHRGWGWDRAGSFRGDVWDRVLAGNGFDVASFRSRHGIPRRAGYNKHRYTRKGFEEMWAGMAELCPYYHDYERPCGVFYSAKSLFAFRSLWHQWGAEIKVGGFRAKPPPRTGIYSSKDDDSDDDEEWWSDEEAGTSDDSSGADSGGERDGDSDSDGERDGHSDRDSDQDSDGGCRLE